jgi:hypothetical protein
MTDGGDYLLLTEETIYDWWRRLSMTDGGDYLWLMEETIYDW